ncbi:histone-lysine N-methyltransferase family member SUVH9-like [Solanum stenotomum]|uniref:histone-lysine N-methyltransferase family member SUVH9-like n=1 Tax=Solanum stenotomum TaxID=172797 RepID=UPI0020D00FCB|nr:histone-lysine N-methyltransferase family member SUVH9-like [Solanum stenotomum]
MEMGSVVGLEDVNFPTEPKTPTPTMIFPKIEPKLEPLDEFTPQSINPNSNFSYNSGFRNTTPQQQQQNATSSQTPSSIEAGVHSEYNRISELFQTAFAQSLQRDGDVEANEDSGCRAIVPVSNDSQVSDIVITRRKYEKRSSELVRVTDLKPEDERYFRDLIRKTRMLYDSLRIFVNLEDENNQHLGSGRQTRARGDLKASQMMREHGLWLNRDKRTVGPIPGVLVGDLFLYRMELCVVGLHGTPQAGIDYLPANQSSNGEPIATSVIASGGYEDDEDAGDVIIYTGQGGQDKNSRQVVHQKLEGGNLALERSMYYGVEVRVIRGFKYVGSSSGKVYVYDGLYRITESWFDVGKSGFGVYKYKLVRIENQPDMGSAVLRFAESLRTRPLEVRPMGYISLDISRKKENVPVFLFNDIDNERDPACYDYLLKTVFPPYVYQHVGNGSGCECTDGCGNGTNCFCAMKNGGQFAYDTNGILLRGKPVIFECGPHCSCPPTCWNRVSQKGVRNRFEVFRSRETGWGVRSLDLLLAGSFICEYTGVVLTQEQAQIFTMNGDSLIYPSHFAERWAEWGDLSRIDSNYVRPAYPSIPPLDFAMDVSRMRNLACYMSHSSSPNVLVQPVLYDHNSVSFPHLMLFAMENIPPLRELSIDYGMADDCTGKLAICN